MKLKKKYKRIKKSVSKSVNQYLRQKKSQKKIRQYLGEDKELFIEVGAGDKAGQNGWLTIDMTTNCDIFWDLRKGIPFPDETVAKIYSSHFFEHLTYKEGQIFLDECLRVLIPGGHFSICVPNARIYIEAYLNAHLESEKFFVYKPAYNDTTKIDYINYTAYMDGHHKYMFDEDNLLHILKSKGLRDVRLREFEAGLDLEARDFESIYAEGVK
ncbi:MAG: methyltransferase domain-containing protein [Desulfobacterales bacterium]|nr:methyltransferase domain-containing protein [Desulfobacterales bacterium]